MLDTPESKQTRSAKELTSNAESQPSLEEAGRLAYADRIQELGLQLPEGRDLATVKRIYELFVTPTIKDLFKAAARPGPVECNLLAVAQCPENPAFEFLVLVRDQNGNIGMPASPKPLFIPPPKGDGQFAGVLAFAMPAFLINPAHHQSHANLAVAITPFFSAPFFRNESIAFAGGAHSNLIGQAVSHALHDTHPDFAGVAKAWLSLDSNVRQSWLLVRDKRNNDFVVKLAISPETPQIALDTVFALGIKAPLKRPGLSPSQALVHDNGKCFEMQGYQPADLEELKPYAAALTPLLAGIFKKQHGLIWQKTWRIEIDWAGANEELKLAECLISIRDPDLNCIVPAAPGTTITTNTYSGFMVAFSSPLPELHGLMANQRVPFSLRYLAYLYQRRSEEQLKKIRINPWALVISEEVIESELAKFLAGEKQSLFYTQAARTIAKEVLGDESRACEVEILAVKAGLLSLEEKVRHQPFLVTTREGHSLLSFFYSHDLGLVHPTMSFHFVDFFRDGANS